MLAQNTRTFITKSSLLRNKYFYYCFSAFLLTSSIGADREVLCYIYLCSFILCSLYVIKYRSYRTGSLYTITFFFFNAYVLLPILNDVFILGEPIYVPPFQNAFNDFEHKHFVYFLQVSLVSLFAYTLFSIPHKKAPARGIEISLIQSLLLFLLGIAFFFAELFISGANAFIFSNSGMVREKMGSVLPFHEYIIITSSYFCGKTFTLKRNDVLLKILSLLFIFLFAFFLIISGFRGDGLVVILAFVVGYSRNERIIFRLKYILTFALVFFGIVSISISQRAKTVDIPKLVEFVSENPQFLNLTTIEYFAAYYNFNIMHSNNFSADYPMQSYIENFSLTFKQYLNPNPNDKPYIYIYRDRFHSSRKKKSGTSGGTGFSIHYESIMNLGPYLFWVSFVFIGLVFSFIDKLAIKHGYQFELLPVLLLPEVITFARSPLPVFALFTKLIYAIAIIYMLVFIKKFFSASLENTVLTKG